MRVTFGSIFRNGLIDINRTTQEPADRQREVSSGRLIHLPTDDLAAMAAAMGERSEMAVLDQDRALLDTQHRAADARRSSAEDARLAESISAIPQADAAHRAALGALANVGRLSLMDYLK